MLLYTDPAAMAPFTPELDGALEELRRLVGKSENTARALAEALIGQGLLATGNRFAPYRVAYPIGLSPVLFSGLYPVGPKGR